RPTAAAGRGGSPGHRLGRAAGGRGPRLGCHGPRPEGPAGARAPLGTRERVVRGREPGRPDGRSLLIATVMRFRMWEVGQWQPVRRIPKQTGGAAAAFSPDGKVLAGQLTPTTACLFGTGTWRPLARLQGPDGQQIDRMGFTPDGTRLLVSGSTNIL